MFSSEFAGWDLGAQWFALRSAGWELEVRDESAGRGAGDPAVSLESAGEDPKEQGTRIL